MAFIEEIKLSYQAYKYWLDIKDIINNHMFMHRSREILYSFSSTKIAEELVEFLQKQGFEIILGEKIWDNIPDFYDKDLFKQYCQYDLNKLPPKKCEIERVPCIIKW